MSPNEIKFASTSPSFNHITRGRWILEVIREEGRKAVRQEGRRQAAGGMPEVGAAHGAEDFGGLTWCWRHHIGTTRHFC